MLIALAVIAGFVASGLLVAHLVGRAFRLGQSLEEQIASDRSQADWLTAEAIWAADAKEPPSPE